MFEKIKQQIANELLDCNISNIDEYIYELHQILVKYLKQVPEQSDYEFYGFAAKFLQYCIDEDIDIISLYTNAGKIFIDCPVEICEVTNALSSQSGEDITDDIIKILSTAKISGFVNNEESAQELLDEIFTFTNHDWSDMDNQWIHCNWNQVMLTTNLDEEIIEDAEDPEFNDYVPDEDEDYEDEIETSTYYDIMEELERYGYKEGDTIPVDDLYKAAHKVNFPWSREDDEEAFEEEFDVTIDWSEVAIKNENDSGIIFYDDESIAELEADGVITDWYKGPGNYDTYNDFTPVDLVSDFPDKFEDSVLKIKNPKLNDYLYNLAKYAVENWDGDIDTWNFYDDVYSCASPEEQNLLDSYLAAGESLYFDKLGLTTGEQEAKADILNEIKRLISVIQKENDDPNFGVDALFSFICVTGPDSAEQALELIYNECGWVGHPEDEIEAGTDFPIYGEINQEEADNFNANMNAIFEYYDGDPNEFTLACIDPEATKDFEDE